MGTPFYEIRCIKAHMAVLCTNAYLPVNTKLQWDHLPVRGQMLCTTPQNLPRTLLCDHGFDCGGKSRWKDCSWRMKPRSWQWVGYEDVARWYTRFYDDSYDGLGAWVMQISGGLNMGFSRDGLPLVGACSSNTDFWIYGHGFGFAWLQVKVWLHDHGYPDTFVKICSPRRFVNLVQALRSSWITNTTLWHANQIGWKIVNGLR